MSGLIELIIFVAVIFGPAVLFLWARDKRKRGKLSAHGLLPTDKTILSGTVPHMMGGELSERLRGFAELPECEWGEDNNPNTLLERAVEAAKAMDTFSVLSIERTEGKAPRAKTDGIDRSWRADGVRPSRMHISQAGWNSDRKLYELDEWITVEDTSYMNPGIWFKLQDREALKTYVEINKALHPEDALHRLQAHDIERAGILHTAEISYCCLETTMKKEADIVVKLQAWIEQASNLIRKFRMAVYENNTLVGEEVTAFADAPSGLSIQAPAGVEADAKEPTGGYSVVEHW